MRPVFNPQAAAAAAPAAPAPGASPQGQAPMDPAMMKAMIELLQGRQQPRQQRSLQQAAPGVPAPNAMGVVAGAMNAYTDQYNKKQEKAPPGMDNPASWAPVVTKA